MIQNMYIYIYIYRIVEIQSYSKFLNSFYTHNLNEIPKTMLFFIIKI